MKDRRTAVFYFSGTGNNLFVAKRLQECIEKVDIFPFHCMDEKPEMLEEYDRIIFSVPSYFSHVPPYVAACMKYLKGLSQKEIITIIGCGGNRGHATEDLRKGIEKAGQKVAGEYMIMLPGNYILSYGAFPKPYQKVTYHFAVKKIKKIAKSIQNNSLTTLNKTGIFYKEKNEARLQESISSFSMMGQKYDISEKCSGCGTCVKVCPVHNILMIDKKPVFSNQCQQCMACIQWCPNKAIDYQGKVAKRKKYHHVEITLAEMIKKNQ